MCLSFDNFKTIIFGTIAEKRSGEIEFNLENGINHGIPNNSFKSFVMIGLPNYFEVTKLNDL